MVFWRTDCDPNLNISTIVWHLIDYQIELLAILKLQCLQKDGEGTVTHKTLKKKKKTSVVLKTTQKQIFPIIKFINQFVVVISTSITFPSRSSQQV